MNKYSPIGIFDSGIGGLSVLRALRKELPLESFIYMADSGNAPYGRLSADEIIKLSSKNTEFLINKNAKLIVVACNTATGAAIKHLRESYSVPFVGMEPAVKPAALLSKTGKIGVLATARTFEADHFNSTVDRYTGDVDVTVKVGDGLVELVEKGMLDTPELMNMLEEYLAPLIKEGIDQLVLGCTHYPFLTSAIRKIIPESIVIHDPAPAVASQTRRVLSKYNGLVSDKKLLEDEFYSSGNRSVLDEMLINL
jgi:glutamate racemase